MAVSTVVADRTDAQLETEQTDCYRVILFNGAGAEILLQRHSEAYALPKVRVPKFTRPAEQVTSFLRNNWGVATVLLLSECVVSDQETVCYATLEMIEERQRTLLGMDWFPINEAAAHLLDGGDRSALKSSRERVFHQCSAESAPFRRLGWIRRLQEWTQTVLGSHGAEIRDFQQLNGGGSFSLVRFETTQKPVWFKAVGEPNLREFPITLTLAELFPRYLPMILAADPAVNGWLMESAGDSTLRDQKDFDIWRNAVRRLAELQIESIGQSRRLREIGCRDLRIGTLINLAGPFFDSMARLMETQIKTSPAPVTREELSDLTLVIQQSLRMLAEFGIQDTLGHGDFNPENILVHQGNCVFTDWAAAHVGPPILTFEYFVNHLRKACPELAKHEQVLRESYGWRWQSVASGRNVDEALQLSPLIAVYAYAIAGNSWRNPERLSVPAVPGYLRSLTRRMKREADALRERRVSCLC